MFPHLLPLAFRRYFQQVVSEPLVSWFGRLGSGGSVRCAGWWWLIGSSVVDGCVIVSLVDLHLEVSRSEEVTVFD